MNTELPTYDIVSVLRKWAEALDIPSGRFVNEDCSRAAEEIEYLRSEITELKRQRAGYQWHMHECEQIAGKALGYPWYKDDQKNFPGATEADGVCIGVHVGDTIVAELAEKYEKAKDKIAALEETIQIILSDMRRAVKEAERDCQLLKKRKRVSTLTYSLFLDDERYPAKPDISIFLARNVDDAMWAVKTYGYPAMMYLDHDLGANRLSGMDFCKLLCAYIQDRGGLDNPIAFHVHSQNPIGKLNMESYLNGFFDIHFSSL